MRIRKTLVSIFIVTFFIGNIAVLPTRKIDKTIEISEISSVNESKPPVEKTADLETVEENDNWITEEKYSLKIKLLQTGNGFHDSEVEAKDGEIWLGLFEENGEYYLRSTRLKIKRVPDPVYGYKNAGKSVQVNSKNEPVFLLKNARNIKEGKVPNLFRGLDWKDYRRDYADSDVSPEDVLTSLKKGFVQNYDLNGKRYELKVISAENKDGNGLLALVLENEGNRQILHTMRYDYSTSVGTLYWVGDLDHDNKPDFFLDLYVHDNVDNKVIFLSSEAEKGKLVKKVAYFWTTGC